MRVLHLCAGNLFGGVENLQLTLSKYRFLAPEMEPEFAMCFSGRLAEELERSGSCVHVLGDTHIRDPLSIIRSNQKLDRLLRILKCDIAICHMNWPLVLFGLTLRRNRVPTVFWTHLATDGKHWLERLASRMQPVMTISPSAFTKSSVSRLFPDVEARVIYYPVPEPRKFEREAARTSLRKEFSTPLGDVVIVQVSRMEPMKGHILHLEGLARLREIPGWTCWMVGGVQRESEIRYFERLTETADQLGISDRIRFTGERGDVSGVLAAADIYCQPNISNEGLPISFTEAFYAGLPVVTTRIGGFWEAVDETCGRLVTPNDPDALAADIKSLIENKLLRLELGERGQQRARKMFDPAVQIPKLHTILKEATQSGKGTYLHSHTV
jgi:glycosyltransferase involved in cell wall biosynthesis